MIDRIRKYFAYSSGTHWTAPMTTKEKVVGLLLLWWVYIPVWAFGAYRLNNFVSRWVRWIDHWYFYMVPTFTKRDWR